METPLIILHRVQLLFTESIWLWFHSFLEEGFRRILEGLIFFLKIKEYDNDLIILHSYLIDFKFFYNICNL